jgi:hypothetical protein
MPKPRHLEPGKTERVEVVVAQGLLDRAVGASHRIDNGLLKASPPAKVAPRKLTPASKSAASNRAALSKAGFPSPSQIGPKIAYAWRI